MEMVSLPEGDDLEEIAAAICAEAGIAEATVSVVEMARRCLASQSLSDLSEGGDVYREVPFVTDHEGKVLLGRIDLLVRKDGRVIVVDYKTDAVAAGGEGAAAERHRGQTGVYGRSVRASIGAEASEQVLFARSGTVIEVA